MNRLFLVDTENTNDYSFLWKYKVCQYDSVYLIYNEKSQKLSFPYMKDLFNIGCNVEFIETKHTGIPNGMDFQISTLLGILVSNFNTMVSGYYIVSKDKGYIPSKELINVIYPDLLVDLINPDSLDLNQDLVNNYKPNGLPKLVSKISKSDSYCLSGDTYKEIILDYLRFLGYSNEESEKTFSLMYKHRLEPSILHNALVKEIPAGMTLYRQIKRFLNKSNEEVKLIISSEDINSTRRLFKSLLS